MLVMRPMNGFAIVCSRCFREELIEQSGSREETEAILKDELGWAEGNGQYIQLCGDCAEELDDGTE